MGGLRRNKGELGRNGKAKRGKGGAGEWRE